MPSNSFSLGQEFSPFFRSFQALRRGPSKPEWCDGLDCQTTTTFNLTLASNRVSPPYVKHSQVQGSPSDFACCKHVGSRTSSIFRTINQTFTSFVFPLFYRRAEKSQAICVSQRYSRCKSLKVGAFLRRIPQSVVERGIPGHSCMAYNP